MLRDHFEIGTRLFAEFLRGAWIFGAVPLHD